MAGNKNSGRPKIEEELRMYKEKIKQITIEELATAKVYKHLEEKDDDKAVKDIALPVYLKSKADKVDHSGEVTVNGFNLITNDSRHSTDNQTGDSLEDTTE